jgi:inorganic triphosphatase YgiF
LGYKRTPLPAILHRRRKPEKGRRMAREVELKLEIPRAAADQVAELPWLRALISGPATRENLVTVYFDTRKHRLRAHGLSLRIRRAGGKQLQTIKTLGDGANGAFGRGEWEREVGRDRPDLKLAAGTALEKLATKKLARKLRSVFETAVERTAIPLRCDGAEVELAIDRGHIASGGHRAPISEIELELKRGDPAALRTLADRLSRALPAAYGVLAKSERGYALSEGEAGQPAGAEPIALPGAASTRDALTAIGLSCLKQLISNQDAVRAGAAEGVHQMRVGLRRLRAALSIFKELTRGEEAEAIKAELKWLTGELGPAREFEVLIEERVRKLRRAKLDAAGARVLKQDLDARRRQALANARAALDSERYRRLGLRIALWLAQGGSSRAGDPLDTPRRGGPARDFAAEVLARRLKKIVKKIARVDELTVRERHKLRIATKKLRYATEFFASLFAGRKREARGRRLGDILEGLQDSLGTLHDIAAHKQLAQRIIAAGKPPAEPGRRKAEKSYAMGFITGQEQKQIAACLAAAAKAGRRLSKAKPFWR